MSLHAVQYRLKYRRVIRDVVDMIGSQVESHSPMKTWICRFSHRAFYEALGAENINRGFRHVQAAVQHCAMYRRQALRAVTGPG